MRRPRQREAPTHFHDGGSITFGARGGCLPRLLGPGLDHLCGRGACGSCVRGCTVTAAKGLFKACLPVDQFIPRPGRGEPGLREHQTQSSVFVLFGRRRLGAVTLNVRASAGGHVKFAAPFPGRRRPGAGCGVGWSRGPPLCSVHGMEAVCG